MMIFHRLCLFRFVGNTDHSSRFHLISGKKIGQHLVITLAIDGDRISCLISKEIRPDDAIIPQSGPNGKFLGMPLRFSVTFLTHANSNNFVCSDH